MNSSISRVIIFVMVIIVLVAIIIWIAWGNTALKLNEITIKNKAIPKNFSGYRIAQISDLHNNAFGENNSKLIEKLAESKPDIIVITGDLIDSRNTDIQIAVSFAEQAVNIAPTYFVSGNHEYRIDNYADLKKGLLACGVILLENEKTTLSKSEESITIIGVSGANRNIGATLEKLADKNNGYTLLLSHYPELFNVYVKNSIDLAFTGHAHGGQFRLPFIGGLVAPGQGLFPKYTAGTYTKQDTTMVVSRGIGNSIFPFRFNNRPEIVVVTLKGE